jgi:pimeloyl-ACP methyl ester carboxylesterase
VGQESALLLGSRVSYWASAEDSAHVVVMLHGMAADHTGLLDLAAGLHGVRVIVPDLPGFGSSDQLSGRHTLDNYAAVIEELRLHLGVDRFTLLGHSLGGSIALAYAGRYGDGLDALCLLGPVLVADNLTARLSKLYYGLSTRLSRLGTWALLTSRLAVYLSARAIFSTSDRSVRRRILRRDYATARVASPRAIRESYLSLLDTPFDQYADAIRVPTLLVTGELDRLCTPHSLTQLRQHVPSAQLTIVPTAGHLLVAEDPELTAGIVSDFLFDYQSAGLDEAA